jgi:hypothetical protein
MSIKLPRPDTAKTMLHAPWRRCMLFFADLLAVLIDTVLGNPFSPQCQREAFFWRPFALENVEQLLACMPVPWWDFSSATKPCAPI